VWWYFAEYIALVSQTKYRPYQVQYERGFERSLQFVGFDTDRGYLVTIFDPLGDS
jgi:hypothetical protein